MEYGCIGEHLPHSFSKEIHELLGNYDYALRELKPEELGPFMEAKAFRAINVTIPYKQAVLPYLDQVDAAASAIGAVNTIVNKNGKLYGFNTDQYGMEALIRKENILLKGKKVLILGTGGTSKTAYYTAKRLGASEIVKVSRRPDSQSVSYEDAVTLHADARVIINTTPAGMFPHIYETPIDVNAFPCPESVLDAVYNPLVTQLVSVSRRKGIKAQTGLYMLVAQAVRAYEIFMDTAADEGTADRVFGKVFSSKQNIVLTGMPGSGKTTIGHILAKKLDRELIDTDALLVQKAGCAISEIFAKQGEAYFRNLETDVIKEIAPRSGCVIATGGGAVLRPENVEALKMNGKLYFLDRAPSLLVPTVDRPLASSEAAILQRYKERYGIYRDTADEIIPDNDPPEAVAAETERRHLQ